MRGVLIFVILFMSCFVQMVPTADSAAIVKKNNTGESSRGFSELSSYYGQSEAIPNLAQSAGAAKYLLDYNTVAQNGGSSVQQNILEVIKGILGTESDITTDLGIIGVSEDSVRFSEAAATDIDNTDQIRVDEFNKVITDNDQNTESQSEENGNVPIEQTFEDRNIFGEDETREQDQSRENDSIKSTQKEVRSQEDNSAESQDDDYNKSQNSNKYDTLDQESSETSDDDEQSQEKYEYKENTSSESQGNKVSDKSQDYSKKDKTKIPRELVGEFSKKNEEQGSDETASNDTEEQSHENNDTKEDSNSDSQEHDKSHFLRKRKEETARELISKFYRQKISKKQNEDDESNKEDNRDDEFWRAVMLAIN